MATGWETYPIEFQGGLVTNLGPLQLGIQRPGAARRLINFEPSVQGGYRRILGYTKFTGASVPANGQPLVQGSGQIGDTLLLANLSSAPILGQTLSIAGVDGEYTVTSSTYSEVTKVATVEVSPDLDSSPADKAVVTFSDPGSLIDFVAYYRQRAVVQRGGFIWQAVGNANWSPVSVPSYGPGEVDGGGQTGGTLAVTGLTSSPMPGDTFSIDGVELVYTVTTATTSSITFTPDLDSSPASGADITFLSASRLGSGRGRFVRYNFAQASTIMIVDGVNAPARYDGTTFTVLNDAPSDVIGASHIEEFKGHIFYGKGTTVSFTVPLTDDNFDAGDGAGVINLAHEITGLKVFRDQLIIFCRSKIYRIVGNSFDDFQLLPISLDIGCIEPDTIQEVGGDVAFLGPDGIRLLGGTERIGDFNFGITSRSIQSEVLRLIDSNTFFSSTVIRGKNQYRLFGYNAQIPTSLAQGLLGTQFADQSAGQADFSWAETHGLKVYVADSQYTQVEEFILFANDSGFVYRMEQTNAFDGEVIEASFSTPFLPLNDPRLRKTLYKVTSYLDPDGTVSGTLNVRYDFNQPNSVQPPTQLLQNFSALPPSNWGEGVWGAMTYSNRIETVFNSQVVGSGFTVSLEYNFNEPSSAFSLDAAMLEYKTDDRK